MPLKCPPGFYKVSNFLTGEEECRPDPNYVAPLADIEVIEDAQGVPSPPAATAEPVAARATATAAEASSSTSRVPLATAESSPSPAKDWASLVAAAPLPADASAAAKATVRAAAAAISDSKETDEGTDGILNLVGESSRPVPDKDTGECPEGYVARGNLETGVVECVEVSVAPGVDSGTPILLPIESAVETGRVFRGPAPPPCDEPPYDYSEEAICISNPTAFVPDWTGLSSPFLNERTCQYSVPFQTEECPQGLELHPQVVGYAPEGITSLMEFLNKQSTPLAESVLTSYIQESAQEPFSPAMISTRAYETNLAPRESLKILFKWPFGLVRALRLEDKLAAPLADAPEGASSVELYTDFWKSWTDWRNN